MYDGYAIVTYTAEEMGEKATGQALLVQDGERWLVRAVATRF